MAHVERRCGCGSRSSRGCRCKRDQVRYRARYIDPTGRERSKTFDRVVDADRFVATVETDKLRGTYVDPSAGRVTFRAYAERWRKAQRHRPGTEALYERVLRLHAYPVLGDRGLASVRHSDAQAFITGLSRALAPNTARQVHAIVRTIFRAAVHDAVLPASPFDKIKLDRVHRDRVVPLTIEELSAILDAVPERLHALVVTAAGTGMRSGELLGLTVDAVDFLRREVHVHQQLVYVPGQPPYIGPPKTPESVRTVPLPIFAVDALARHLAAWPAGPDGLIFQAEKGGPILRTTLHGRWVQTLRRAGVPTSTHFHHLRHFYASVLIDGGESVKVVQERLGHASAVETLKTYAHLWPSSDERTRTVVEAAWNSATTDHGLPTASRPAATR